MVNNNVIVLTSDNKLITKDTLFTLVDKVRGMGYNVADIDKEVNKEESVESALGFELHNEAKKYNVELVMEEYQKGSDDGYSRNKYTVRSIYLTAKVNVPLEHLNTIRETIDAFIPVEA